MKDFTLYLNLGWEHIISLDALDHQLFVLVLIMAYSIQDFKKILILVTAFTIGHSLTLALSAMEILRVPGNWVEFLIPLTIVLTALDNLILRNKAKTLMRLNYYLALFFGLIHGMGFANTIRMTLAKEQSLFLPLLGFNIGLELGQILLVVVFLLVSFVMVQLVKIPKRDWALFISSGVFFLAMQMTLERIP
ncbi:HupE/UreJ family protein [Chryseobacterium sp. A301]